MDRTNEETLDYFLLPWVDFSQPAISLFETNGPILDKCRFENLDYLVYLAGRVPLGELGK
jgi:hypothetical protein